MASFPFQRLAAAAALGIALVAPVAAFAVPGDQVGIGAFGNADVIFMCGSNNCDPAGGNLSTQQDSAASGSVEVAYGSIGSNGGAEFAARASSGGALELPVLQALARTQHARGPHPGYSTEGFYDYNSSAIANAVQYFTYTGAVAATYEFTFHADGVVAGILASIDAFAGIFDVDNTLGGELPLGAALVMDRLMYAGIEGSTTPFDDEFTLSLTLEPGQDFYLSTALSANVGRGLQQSGLADAYNTFSAALTQGDAALLRVGPAVVPNGVIEPAPLWLLATAALGFVLSRRRRDAAGV
jgi:hypothetical protein